MFAPKPHDRSGPLRPVTPAFRPAGGRPFSAILGILAQLSVLLLPAIGSFVPLHGAVAASPPGGPFTLQDGDGRTVTDRDFRGRYILIYFGYTFCPDACPATLNEMMLALDNLGAKADRVQAIFITVDPRRDTPGVMQQYAAAFGPRLLGLTGSSEQIAEVTKAYRVYRAESRTGPGPNEYAIGHSSILYLMGPDGGFVGGIRGDQPGAGMADDLSELIP